MRLYELESDFDLTKKSKNKLFPSGPTFTWDPAKKHWLNPDGTQVARDIHFDLMKAVGLDPQGNKLKPGMIDKIKGAWAKSGAGIDPKASALGKVMGRVGGAIGNAIGKNLIEANPSKHVGYFFTGSTAVRAPVMAWRNLDGSWDVDII
jgi:hypothetical protein